MLVPTVRFCKKCQADTERLVSSGRCKPCHQANGAAYAKANPGKRKENAKAWREANPEKYKSSIAASRAKNPDHKTQARARTAAWREANPAYGTAWRLANPEKVKSSAKAYQKAKAAKFALYEAFYLENLG